MRVSQRLVLLYDDAVSTAAPTLPDRRGARASPEVNAARVQADTLAVELAQAIARDEIAILFQPQVRIADDWITGVEALARWDHPLLGALGADPLFAAAERAGLGLALSDHIQAAALHRVAAWGPELAHLDVSLNITAGDLACANFAGAFLARLAASRVAPQRVVVEITETALIADLPAAAAALDMLRAVGIRIAIDDFGAGYAGLAYLKALPLDRLKIDRSFVHDMAESARGRAVVRGVIAMAGALGLAVVAEGVERIAQRDILAAEGCGWYQGFLCAGALDEAALVRLVEQP